MYRLVLAIAATLAAVPAVTGCAAPPDTRLHPQPPSISYAPAAPPVPRRPAVPRHQHGRRPLAGRTPRGLARSDHQPTPGALAQQPAGPGRRTGPRAPRPAGRHAAGTRRVLPAEPRLQQV